MNVHVRQRKGKDGFLASQPGRTPFALMPGGMLRKVRGDWQEGEQERDGSFQCRDN